MGDAALLGLLAALSYGAGDFVSGALSRRLPTLVLLAVGQSAALLVLIPVTALTGGPIGMGAWGWGGLAGAAGAVGGYCFVRGFRAGRLAVVAPAASVTAAGLPILADLTTGVRLSTPAILGVVTAIVAVALVGAREPVRPADSGADQNDAAPRGTGSGLGWGLGAGAAHAAMYVCLGQAPAGAGVGPVTAAFVVTAALAVAAAALGRVRWRLPAREAPAVIVVGVLAAGGTVGFLYAAGAGSIGIAAVTTELSPLVTALLARVVLREPLPPLRTAGLVLAVAAGTLIGIG